MNRTHKISKFEIIFSLAVASLVVLMFGGLTLRTNPVLAPRVPHWGHVVLENPDPTPVFDISIHSNEVSDLDMSTVTHTNAWIPVQFGDVRGSLRIDDTTLFWFDGTNKTPVLKIDVHVLAYTFKTNGDWIALLFWTMDKRGYRCDMAGLIKGVPYFGTIEDQ